MILENIVTHITTELSDRWTRTPTAEIIWLTVGFTAQCMFFMRFVIQWLASEKARRSVMPEAFWYWSIAGGAILLVYSIYRVDPVFILGQATGLIIYVRNVQLILAHRRTENAASGTLNPVEEPAE